MPCASSSSFCSCDGAVHARQQRGPHFLLEHLAHLGARQFEPDLAVARSTGISSGSSLASATHASSEGAHASAWSMHTSVVTLGARAHLFDQRRIVAVKGPAQAPVGRHAGRRRDAGRRAAVDRPVVHGGSSRCRQRARPALEDARERNVGQLALHGLAGPAVRSTMPSGCRLPAFLMRVRADSRPRAPSVRRCPQPKEHRG